MPTRVRTVLSAWFVLAGCSLDDLTAGSPSNACTDTSADFCTEFDEPLPGSWDEVRGTPTVDGGELMSLLPGGSPSCSYSDLVKAFPAAPSVHLTVRLQLGTLDARVVRLSQSNCTHLLYVQPDGLRLHTQSAADTIDQTGFVLETGRWYEVSLDLDPDGTGTGVRVTVDGGPPYEVTRSECGRDGSPELSLGIFCDTGPDEVRFDWARVDTGP